MICEQLLPSGNRRVEATFFADGGTGRFEDAISAMIPTGKFFVDLSDATATIPYLFDFEGTLSY